MRTRYFFIILGETEQEKRQFQLKRIQSIGECHILTENTYLLTANPKEFEYDSNRVMDIVSGEDRLNCIVIQFVSPFDMSWCIEEELSDYISAISNKIDSNFNHYEE